MQDVGSRVHWLPIGLDEAAISSIGTAARRVVPHIDDARGSGWHAVLVQVQTGGTMAGRDELTWRKSVRSSSGACVEVAVRADPGGVLIRDSHDPDGPMLEFDRKAFGQFIACLKDEGPWA
jgi:hypothetical protein